MSLLKKARTSNLALIADTPWFLGTLTDTHRMMIDLSSIAKGAVTSKSANQ